MSANLAGESFSAQRLILSRLAEGEEIESVLAPLVELVEQSVPGAICSIMEMDLARSELHVLAAPGAPSSLVERLGGLKLGRLAASCGSAAFTGQPVFVEDALQDERWFPYREVAQEFGIGSSWSIPIFNAAADEVIGTFAITRSPRGLPSPSQRSLLLFGSEVARLLLMRLHEKRELEEKQMMIEALLHQCEDPVYIKDTDRRYLMVNEAESLGLRDKPDDFQGLRDEDLYEGETLATGRRSDVEVLTTGAPRSYVVEIDNPVRGRRFYHMRKSPLRDASGSVIGLLGTARDLTDLRDKQLSRDRSERLEGIGLIAGGVAHDLNNVLTVIQGNLDLIQAEASLTQSQELSIRDASEATLRATQLVRHLLAAGTEIDAQNSRVDLCFIVRDVLELLRREIPDGVRVDVDLVPHSPQMTGNATQLRQLVMNLTLNAIEAVEPREGRVLLRVWSTSKSGQEPCVSFSVADNGRGMDEATRARISDPFFTTKEQGSGIGMTVVQTVVDAHQAGLTIQSEVGKGTELRVDFPLGSADSKVGDAVLIPRQGPLQGRQVLVVDHDPAARASSTRALERAGARAFAVESFEQAIARLGAQNDIDALVLDLCLPGFSGEELHTAIHRKWPTLPILLVGSTDPRPRWFNLESAARTRLLVKPLQVEELQLEVRNLIQRQARSV